MTHAARRILLIGYGNPGRLDDGLGPALAAAIERLDLPGVTVDAEYQLTVEDAATVAEHEVVIFADADVSGPEPFCLRRIAPKAAVSFSTHSVEPAAVLGIRGYAFNEFGEMLSERARANLAAAVEFLQRAFREGRFSAVGTQPGGGSGLADAGSNEDTRCKLAST